MRIGLSCNTIEPLICGGKLDGIGVYTQKLAQELEKAGETVVPVIFPPLKNRNLVPQLDQALMMSQPYTLGAGLSALTGMDTPGAKKLQAKVDLYHCTDYMVPRLSKVPVLAMLHDAVKVQHPDWNHARFRRLKNLGLKKAVQWADHYVTPSRAVIPELVEHFGIDEKNISVVHLAISEFWYQSCSEAEKAAVIQKHRLRPRFFLFTGTLQPRKNIEGMIKTMKSLPKPLQAEHQLVLVGQRGWIHEEVLAELEQLAKTGLVRWLDYVSNEDLRCLYQAAQLVLLPSLHEGFGFPILEGFAAGTPVITSKLFAMSEIAGQAAYLVNPHETEEIRDAIIHLLENPSAAKHLVNQGKERLKDFSWGKTLQGLLKVYRSMR